jgi:hypothetical protein
MLVTEDRPADPRALFLQDISAYTQLCQGSGHDITQCCIDANETMKKHASAVQGLAHHDTRHILFLQSTRPSTASKRVWVSIYMERGYLGIALQTLLNTVTSAQAL